MKLALFVVVAFGFTNASYYPNPRKYVCYFDGWSLNNYDESSEKGPVINNLQDFIPFKYCTHVVFAAVSLSTRGVVILDSGPGSDIKTGEFTRKVREAHEATSPIIPIKVMFALGGRDCRSEGIERMMGISSERESLIDDLEEIVNSGGFDGIDIHWMFVRVGEGKNPENKENLSIFVTELRERFSRYEKLLTVTLVPKRDDIDLTYDLTHLYKTVDWLNVAAYEYTTHIDPKSITGISAPLFGTSDETVDKTITHLLNAGVPSSRIVLGTASFATTFTLLDKFSTNVGSYVTGHGYSTSINMEVLEFPWLCDFRQAPSNGWTEQAHENSMYAYYDTPTGDKMWLSFDTNLTFYHKGLYASSKRLGGVSVWSFIGFTDLQCPLPYSLQFEKLFDGVRTCPDEAKNINDDFYAN